MSIPEELRYSKEHEWVRQEDAGARIGITFFAQDQLGDVVYVELPKAGDSLKAMQPFGVVESVKAASDLYSPVTGKVLAVNEDLIDRPELVNEAPYEGGWMLLMELGDAAEVDGLMDAAGYGAHIESEG